MKGTIIANLNSAHGTNGLVQGQKDLELRVPVETIQTTALLR